MYSWKEKNLYSVRDLDVFLSIEDYDVFNSEFIYRLDRDERYEVLINNTFDKRMDLIVKECYSNYDFYGIFGINNRYLNNSELSLGRYLKFLPKERITANITKIYAGEQT